MEILQNSEDKKVILNLDLSFNPDLDKEESLVQFEEETLQEIINPIENYETVRFIHSPYSGLTDQYDIWYYFYFYNNLPTPTHIGGLDYSLTGIEPRDNALMLKHSTQSFFRLEFYKVPDGELPERKTRRLVFSKNLPIPSGEKVFYQTLNDNIFVPVFVGTNYRNTENLYLFWFMDDSALSESILTGNTFYMTARFFNATDGSIINFANKSKSTTATIIESEDLYYQVEINKIENTYCVFYYEGNEITSNEEGEECLLEGIINADRVGMRVLPIKFYEILGG